MGGASYQCCDTAFASPTCAAPQSPVAELCNSLDDDCDGTADDGNPEGGGYCYPAATIGCVETPPGSGVFNCDGSCAPGVYECVGSTLVCTNAITPVLETCNDIDDDCNAVVDDFPAWDGFTEAVEGAPCPTIAQGSLPLPCSAGT